MKEIEKYKIETLTIKIKQLHNCKGEKESVEAEAYSRLSCPILAYPQMCAAVAASVHSSAAKGLDLFHNNACFPYAPSILRP